MKTEKTARIHFTEDKTRPVEIREVFNEAGDERIIACIGYVSWADVPTISQTLPELEKMRLEAVIQKEAEEKYPDWEPHSGLQITNAGAFYQRQGFIQAWQSLLSRLPSEEDWEDYLEKIPLNETEDGFAYKQHDGFIYAINLIKSKLLPSLPSTLSCQYEEENGKVTVKSMKA